MNFLCVSFTGVMVPLLNSSPALLYEVQTCSSTPLSELLEKTSRVRLSTWFSLLVARVTATSVSAGTLMLKLRVTASPSR